jgi:mono/diheme cytochrome c family protein
MRVARVAPWGALVAAAVVAVLAQACDDGGSSANVAEAGPASTSSAPSSLVDPAVLERGEYLVRNVAGCGECHTPRDAQGNLDMSRWMAGVANRFDLTPDDDSTGAISAPNLTPEHLASWTDAQITGAFLEGVSSDGSPLFPLMPYYAYHNMTASDAAAIVTYLRALTPIGTDTPARQPLPVPLVAPAPPLDESSIPHTTLAASDPRHDSAEHGRYLAGEIGFCLDCHTPWRLGVSPPLDLARVFAGGRPFSSHDWSVPSPAPAVVYSYDLTPHASGIAGWTVDDVVAAIQTGRVPGGAVLCRPMPSGPSGSFGGLLAQDARDIGTYLTTLAPVDAGDIPRCP